MSEAEAEQNNNYDHTYNWYINIDKKKKPAATVRRMRNQKCEELLY